MQDSQSEFVFVYATFPDRAAAQRVADAMVTAGLAESVHVHGPMTCVQAYEGKLETGEEYATYIKTLRTHAGHVIAAARPMYSHAIPCFLILPIDNDNDDYLAWARA
jgi:periplasmic divalent cation tolerance protein